MDEEEELKWVVEIDLSPRTHGALRFAKWMHARAAAPLRLLGVHVAEPTETKTYPGRGLPVEKATLHAQASVESVRAQDVFESVEATMSTSPEDALSGFAEFRDANGLIVGRVAPAEGWSLVSLGKVTRRLLRNTPVPVMVVPPKLDLTQLGGPVVAAVTPDPSCNVSVSLARRLSRALDLPLLLVHVYPPAAAIPFATVNGPAAQVTATPPRSTSGNRPTDALKTWLARRRLSDVPLRLKEGVTVTPQLLDSAAEVRASVIVCGSRQLSFLERVLARSVGTSLAAHADRPVVVAPPLAA